MDEMGNNNPALWRIGPQEDGIYLAVTDAKVSTRWTRTKINHYILIIILINLANPFAFYRVIIKEGH